MKQFLIAGATLAALTAAEIAFALSGLATTMS